MTGSQPVESQPDTAGVAAQTGMFAARSAPNTSQRSETWRNLARALRSPLVALSLLTVFITLVWAVFAPWLAPQDPLHVAPVDRLKGIGSPGHILGTDTLGRDVLSRLIYGARVAWTVGGTVAVGSTILGCILGLFGGFYRGWIDAVGSRVIDGLLAVPGLLLALVFAAMFGTGTRTAIIALVIVFSPVVARVVRSSVLVERELDYVRASRGIGNREIRTLMRHVLPNVLSPVLVVATLVASRSIIVESSLSFLGVGTQPPTASWGLMIKEGRATFLEDPAIVIVPAVTLTLLVVAINMVADAVSDYLDPTGRVTLTSGVVRSAD
jgi:ABC-type dipeptide/oligopeptide/nickel transport system permease subunit